MPLSEYLEVLRLSINVECLTNYQQGSKSLLGFEQGLNPEHPSHKLDTLAQSNWGWFNSEYIPLSLHCGVLLLPLSWIANITQKSTRKVFNTMTMYYMNNKPT